VGGVLCLSFCYLAFIQSPSPWIKLNVATAADVRASFLFAAIWFFIFALPLFLFFAEESTPQKKKYLYVTRDAFEQVRRSFREIGRHVSIVRFLVARMIFTDALITLFAFGGIYATAQFGMTEQEILIFGIVLNISAGVGAAFFAFLDDLLGGKTMILISLLGLFISSIIALSASTRFLFWIGAIAVGGFVGPVQASSRSYLARVAPLRLRNQMFGFFALSSKVTAFLGPLSVSWITYLTNSLRVGMFSILIFLVIGFFLMLYVEKDTGCF
jgi:UMF1 family MFS transporter